MTTIFRPFTFNKLKPLLQQRFYSKAAFDTFGVDKSLPDLPSKISMDLRQSINNQTQVSNTLATHLLSNKPNSNVVFSPLSIHVVLSLLAAGSKDETLDQLHTFLNTNTTDDLNSLHSQLASSILVDGSPNGGPQLSFANGLWVEKTRSLKPSFKQVVDTVYKASCKQVDFTKADEATNEVNLWAEKQTNGLVKKVITRDAIKDRTWLIFANAVYFKGAWAKKFNLSMTIEADFHLLDGSKVQVPFMNNWGEQQFVREYDDFKVLGLCYFQGQDKRQFKMYFFLPNAKDGLPSLVEKVGSTSDFFGRHIPRQKVHVGKFFIPRFKITFEFEASDMLKDLGLLLPFNEKVGMAEMVESRETLYVSSIHHKSVVEVNEEGTKAAAVTACGIRSSSLIKDRVDFVADRPFLFIIREDVTGVVLFMGQVIDPRVG